MTDPGRFKALEGVGGPLQRGIMPIIAQRENTFFPVGTGFCIAGNIMLTATHVLRYAAEVTGHAIDKGPMGLYALYITDEHHGINNEWNVGGLLPIDKAWMLEDDHDTATCRLNLPTRDDKVLELPIARLSPGLPHFGQPIVGVGYHSMDLDIAAVEGPPGTLSLNYRQSATMSVGHVTDVYPLRRESGLLKFPSMRTTAYFPAGMSGGPVFNQRGFVCGVITAGSSFEEASYASLIYSAFACIVEGRFREDEELEEHTIYDLANAGAVVTDETFKFLEVTKKDRRLGSISVRNCLWQPSA